jgi:hypothetical protein
MALILLVVPSIFAQEETFGLSDEDFALFTAAGAATAEVESFTFDFSASFVLQGTGESDVNVDLSGTGAIATGDAPALQLTLSGEMESEGETQPLNAEVRLVDGILYVNDGSGWKGQAADDLFSEVGGMTGMDVNPEDVASGDLSDLAGMEGMSEAMAALSNLDPSEFISMTRTDSDGLAQFTIEVSISDLLSSPSLAPLFMMGMSGGASVEGMEMSEEQAQAMVDMFAEMFSEATVSFDEYIDPATSLLQRAVLDVNIPIPDMSGTGQSTTLVLNVDLSLGGFDEPVVVEAPADAVMQD